jgi:hypothetical protein
MGVRAAPGRRWSGASVRPVTFGTGRVGCALGLHDREAERTVHDFGFQAVSDLGRVSHVGEVNTIRTAVTSHTGTYAETAV